MYAPTEHVGGGTDSQCPYQPLSRAPFDRARLAGHRAHVRAQPQAAAAHRPHSAARRPLPENRAPDRPVRPLQLTLRMPEIPQPSHGSQGEVADVAEESRDLVHLWLRHRRELVLQSLRLLGHHAADAEDAVENALLRLLENRRRFGPIQNPKALFQHLVFNSCMDLHRRHRHSTQHVSVDELEDEVMARGPTVEAQYEAMEAHVLLVRALSSLPANLRQMLVARAGGTSYGELAEQARITPVNARKRVQQAREILRQRMLCPRDSR